jgi:hypothetical protein
VCGRALEHDFKIAYPSIVMALILARLVTCLAVLALVFASPGRGPMAAASMPQTTTASHSPSCPDNGPSSPMKMPPCAALGCPSQFATDLQTPQGLAQPSVEAVRLPPAASDDLTGWARLPEPPPPKPSAHA